MGSIVVAHLGGYGNGDECMRTIPKWFIEAAMLDHIKKPESRNQLSGKAMTDRRIVDRPAAPTSIAVDQPTRSAR
jgi:hypothetical protein